VKVGLGTRDIFWSRFTLWQPVLFSLHGESRGALSESRSTPRGRRLPGSAAGPRPDCRAQGLEGTFLMPRIPFMFAIPFGARGVALDWDRACASLAHTLRSVLNQSDSEFYVGVCCHDIPVLPAEIRGRVNLIEVDFPPPTGRSEEMYRDKMRKKEKLAQVLSTLGGGYYFALDADDLVSRDLVAYAREEADANGYLIEAGYVLDANAGTLAPVPGAWGGKPLHQVCGSCAILNLSCPELPGGELFHRKEGLFARMKQHGRYGVDAAAIGRPLKPIPFPAVVYVLNTGNNISYTLRRDPARQAQIHRDIDRNSVPVSPELAERFGLPLLD
jgi:Putative rhamnosyl transferase